MKKIGNYGFVKVAIIAFLFAVTLLFTSKLYADNYALNFDGVDDYISVSDSDDWTFGSGNFTIDLWAKFNDIKTSVYAAHTDLAATGHFGWWFRYDSTRKLLTFEYSTTGSEIVPELSVDWLPPVVGEWYHMALVRDATSLYFFVNGEQVGQPQNMSQDAIYDSSVPFTMGCSHVISTPEGFLNGWMDEARLWDCARTQQQIQDLMNTQLFGNEPGLIAYWNFNEGGGQAIHDLTGNGHDGWLGFQSTGDLSDPYWVVSDSPPDVVPEPSSMLLLALGGLGFGIFRRKRPHN